MQWAGETEVKRGPGGRLRVKPWYSPRYVRGGGIKGNGSLSRAVLFRLY